MGAGEELEKLQVNSKKINLSPVTYLQLGKNYENSDSSINAENIREKYRFPRRQLSCSGGSYSDGKLYAM